MRGLKHLIPKEVADSLNANPTFQWVAIVAMVIIGVVLVVTGIDGVKNKRIKGKHGRVFEGTTAQVLGVVYAVLGAAIVVVAVVTKLAV